MLIAVAQGLVEGPRWQMVPAYALTALCLLVSMSNKAAHSSGIAERFQLPQLVAVLGMAWLAVAVALPMLMPVFGFPTPGGPYAIGSVTTHWVDDSRVEAFAADPKARRQLMVQVWYPAQADPSAPRVGYMADADALTAALARVQNIPAFVFGHFKYVTTNARSAVAVAAGQARYPVLLFLEGATGFRQMNAFQVEHLVSHGYIAVAIDQPGAAAVVFPDGHLAVGLTVPQFRSMVDPSYMPVGTQASRTGLLLPNGNTLTDNSIIPYLAQDVSFTLDRLVALNLADPAGILTGRLDLQPIGVFGVSLGGIVAGEACRRDPRLQACLVMDAAMSTDVAKAGLQQPGMWLTRDAASVRLERQRAGGWSEAQIEAHQTSMRAVYESLPADGYFVRVPGMFHSNFTDIANWTPLVTLWGQAGPIGAQRRHDIVNAYKPFTLG